MSARLVVPAIRRSESAGSRCELGRRRRVLRVAGRSAAADRGGMGARGAWWRGRRPLSMGRRSSVMDSERRARTPRGPVAGTPRTAEPIRSARHRREHSRMVRRLAFARVLQPVGTPQPGGASKRRPTRLAGRIVAACGNHQPIVGTQQAVSLVPLYRLWLQGRPVSLDTARLIADRVRAAGGRALILGGWVRDQLLHRPSKDVDIEVFGLPAERLKTLLFQIGPVNVVGESFTVYKVADVDVSLPRTESRIGRGHKAFAVTGDPNLTPAEAARRRDFTINAIAWDPLTGEYIDPFHGGEDLERGLLRAV